MIATSLPGSCNYREGNQWIEERVTGKRQPFGRLGRVDRLRTHVVSFGSNQTEKIIQSALEIAKKEI
jgi:coenzyme F420-reducing hydrogenase delta subunit